MGVWGAGLYQNDISMDIKDKFEKQIQKGDDVEEITMHLIKVFDYLFGSKSYETIFWCTLADVQWEWGRLSPLVKEQALKCIDNGGDLEVWLNNGPKIVLERKNMFEILKNKLNSPQPPIKKIRKRRLYKCEWEIGDVFAYKLESDYAKKKGLTGKYLLIQKVDETTWYPGHIVPIVYIKITKDMKLPNSIEDYNQLEYVQTSFTKYEDRFNPIDGSRPKEDILEKSKIKYEVDEYGFLPEFRAVLIITSKRNMPSNLLYVGNYRNVKKPNKEFIPHVKNNIMSVMCEYSGNDFEETLVKRYCGHNRKEFEVYIEDKKML